MCGFIALSLLLISVDKKFMTPRGVVTVLSIASDNQISVYIKWHHEYWVLERTHLENVHSKVE
jgi:hypothetical protein